MASFAELRKKVKKQRQPTVSPVVAKPKKEEPKVSDSINTTEFDANKTYLVVNGKAREISHKSKYLLDMLIIEEEN